MTATFRCSLYSLLLHATAVLGVFLYCRPGQSPVLLSSDYLIISTVDTAPEDLENYNVASSSAADQSFVAAKNHDGESPQAIEKVARLRIAVRRRKFKRKPVVVRANAMAGTDLEQGNPTGPRVAADEDAVGRELDGPSGSHNAVDENNGPTDSAGGAVESAATAGGAKSAYLSTNYEYIREIVTHHLTFPASARKRRLSGRIEVSFLIEKDGGVGDIHVDLSSGHVLLDMKVVSAIQRSAPFPAPPQAARIALPIVFRLK